MVFGSSLGGVMYNSFGGVMYNSFGGVVYNSFGFSAPIWLLGGLLLSIFGLALVFFKQNIHTELSSKE